MRFTRIMLSTVSVMLVGLLCCMGFSSTASSATVADSYKPDSRMSQSDAQRLVAAIQDEIYFYGYERQFWGFQTSGPNGPAAEFLIYATPTLIWNGKSWTGQVLYKYPPFGEVIRRFFLSENRASLDLSGTPASGFSWNQPDTLTIYSDDSVIRRFKHTWLKIPFQLDLKPSSQRLMEAAQRQKTRMGTKN